MFRTEQRIRTHRERTPPTTCGQTLRRCRSEVTRILTRAYLPPTAGRATAACPPFHRRLPGCHGGVAWLVSDRSLSTGAWTRRLCRGGCRYAKPCLTVFWDLAYGIHNVWFRHVVSKRVATRLAPTLRRGALASYRKRSLKTPAKEIFGVLFWSLSPLCRPLRNGAGGFGEPAGHLPTGATSTSHPPTPRRQRWTRPSLSRHPLSNSPTPTIGHEKLGMNTW